MFREVPKDRLVEVYASEEFWNRERKAVEQVLAGTKVQPEILADFVFEYVSDTKTPQGDSLPGASENNTASLRL